MNKLLVTLFGVLFITDARSCVVGHLFTYIERQKDWFVAFHES